MGKESKRLKFWALLVLLCGLVFLLSCGGGSSGGGDDSNPNNSSPVVQIASPADGSNFAVGDEIQFSGSCNDSEDGVLSGSSLVWTSDLDGQIGTGKTFNSTTLSTGSHQITLTGTDSNRAVGTDSVTIIISQTVTGLFDLTAGRTFNYKVTDLNNNSNSWLSTIYIQNTEIIGSTIYYHLIVTNEYGKNEVQTFTARSTKDELYFLIGGTEVLWFKTGNIGFSFIRDPGEANDNVTITAIGDITVPYGVVSAYEFSITEQGAASPYLIQSVSPGIGLVREVNYDEHILIELVSWGDDNNVLDGLWKFKLTNLCDGTIWDAEAENFIAYVKINNGFSYTYICSGGVCYYCTTDEDWEVDIASEDYTVDDDTMTHSFYEDDDDNSTTPVCLVSDVFERANESNIDGAVEDCIIYKNLE